MTIDKLKAGERFKTVFTNRKGVVIEHGINTVVEWGLSETVKDLSGNGNDIKTVVRRVKEIISSKTEVERICGEQK